MKIALCLSGERREFRTAYRFFSKNLLNQFLNVDLFDIYIHTIDNQNRDDDVHTKDYNQGSIDEYINLYKPIQYIIEKYDTDKKEKYRQEILYPLLSKINNHKVDLNQIKQQKFICEKCHLPYSLYEKLSVCLICGGKYADSTYSQINGVCQSLELAINSGIRYDAILRARPDLVLKTKIPINLFQLCNYQNILIVPTIKYPIKKKPPVNGFVLNKVLQDFLFWGSFDIMTKLANTMKNIENMFINSIELGIYQNFPTLADIGLRYFVYTHSPILFQNSVLDFSIVRKLGIK